MTTLSPAESQIVAISAGYKAGTMVNEYFRVYGWQENQHNNNQNRPQSRYKHEQQRRVL